MFAREDEKGDLGGKRQVLLQAHVLPARFLIFQEKCQALVRFFDQFLLFFLEALLRRWKWLCLRAILGYF